MFGKWILALAFALASFAAIAAPPYVDIEQRLTAEQLKSTGLDTLSPAQLELLNRLLREESVKVVEAVQAEASASAKETAAVKEERDKGSFMGFNDAPIKSRLKGTVSEWAPGYVFELENGQQWKVLKGSAKLYKPLQNPEVSVVPGFAGRWFMQVDEDTSRPRVYRIDD